MQEPPPHHFKAPQLENYDETVNLIDHFEGFKIVMLLYGAIDAILCRVFLSNLKGMAQHWYYSLKSALPTPLSNRVDPLSIIFSIADDSRNGRTTSRLSNKRREKPSDHLSTILI